MIRPAEAPTTPESTIFVKGKPARVRSRSNLAILVETRSPEGTVRLYEQAMVF